MFSFADKLPVTPCMFITLWYYELSLCNALFSFFIKEELFAAITFPVGLFAIFLASCRSSFMFCHIVSKRRFGLFLQRFVTACVCTFIRSDSILCTGCSFHRLLKIVWLLCYGNLEAAVYLSYRNLYIVAARLIWIIICFYFIRHIICTKQFSCFCNYFQAV